MRHHRLASALVAAALVLALGGCALLDLQRPSVAVVDVGLENVGLLQSSLVVTLRVDNPNAFRLPIERGVYTLFLAGDRVGVGGLRSPLDVPARSSSTHDIVIDFDNLRLLSRLRDVLGGEAVSYRLEAEHYLSGLRSQALRSVSEGELAIDGLGSRR